MLDFGEYTQKAGVDAGPAIRTQVAAVNRAKAPPFRYWLAYENSRPCGYFSSWGGMDGFGVVEDLFVHAEFRHRGVATALMERCVADCRERGAKRVLIPCDSGDTPKHMYAAMGFVPVALNREYRKFLP